MSIQLGNYRRAGFIGNRDADRIAHAGFAAGESHPCHDRELHRRRIVRMPKDVPSAAEDKDLSSDCLGCICEKGVVDFHRIVLFFRMIVPMTKFQVLCQRFLLYESWSTVHA